MLALFYYSIILFSVTKYMYTIYLFSFLNNIIVFIMFHCYELHFRKRSRIRMPIWSCQHIACASVFGKEIIISIYDIGGDDDEEDCDCNCGCACFFICGTLRMPYFLKRCTNIGVMVRDNDIRKGASNLWIVYAIIKSVEVFMRSFIFSFPAVIVSTNGIMSISLKLKMRTVEENIKN